MKILVEGHAYAPEVVRNILPEKRLMLADEMVTVENVGYFRNPECDDFVFFLPKVLLEQVPGVAGDRVFPVKGDGALWRGFAPEEILDPEAETPDGRRLGKAQRAFLYEFAVWIYRAISQFKARHPKSGVVWEKRENQAGGYRRRKVATDTLLDVILALLRFDRENRDYFLFKVREKRAGTGRADWARTVAREQAVVQGGIPVYPAVRTKRREIDFDEELLVIFYSILAHVREKFGFPVEIGGGWPLVTGARFERYLSGYGARRLRAIRYKYFSDREVALWQLCFAFFDKAHKADVVAAGEEYLLAKDFNIVFESMIDDLLGDASVAPLKALSDGKEIDHLYLDESLVRRATGGGKTFYVADSKYYKRGNALGGESVAKQFTYARNLVQLDLDLFLGGDDAAPQVKARRPPLAEVGLVRDETTEGYDVVPNFFVSATVPDGFDYARDGLALHGGAPQYLNAHFENRLFDRDTLILSHYNVNFLFVVRLYAQDDAGLKAGWRRKVRAEFRRRVREVLEARFSFYAMMPYDKISDPEARLFLRENFRETLGKVYAPFPKVDGKTVYALALEKPQAVPDDGTLTPEGLAKRRARIAAENTKVENLLRSEFYIVPCKLGDDPSEALKRKAAAAPVPGAGRGDAAESVIVAAGYRHGHIEAAKACGWCPWKADGIANPHFVQMIVLPHANNADVLRVRFNDGPIGPMTPAQILAEPRLAAFRTAGKGGAAVDLAPGDYYAWPVEKHSDPASGA